jgi:N-sulfoglucosamine sulfohydrolase
MRHVRNTASCRKSAVDAVARTHTLSLSNLTCRDPNQPFCLFVCSALPHAAYVAGDPSAFDAGRLILQNHWIDTPKTREDFRLYLAEIAALDQQVGDIG